MRTLFVSATMSLLILMVGTEAPVGARSYGDALDARVQPAGWTPFEGMLYGCSSSGSSEALLTPGNTLHFKGGSNVNLWVTDHPLINGLERNIVDANINFNAGVGRAHAIATLTPDGIGGSWELRFLVRVGGGGASGVGVGRGALEGLRIDFDVQPMRGTPNLCTPGFAFVARVRGTVRGEG
jgi:hypothetical protein